MLFPGFWVLWNRKEKEPTIGKQENNSAWHHLVALFIASRDKGTRRQQNRHAALCKDRNWSIRETCMGDKGSHTKVTVFTDLCPWTLKTWSAAPYSLADKWLLSHSSYSSACHSTGLTVGKATLGWGLSESTIDYQDQDRRQVQTQGQEVLQYGSNSGR